MLSQALLTSMLTQGQPTLDNVPSCMQCEVQGGGSSHFRCSTTMLAPSADSHKGATVDVPITFEPMAISPAVQGHLVVSSATIGEEYVFELVGACTLPTPQVWLPQLQLQLYSCLQCCSMLSSSTSMPASCAANATMRCCTIQAPLRY